MKIGLSRSDVKRIEQTTQLSRITSSLRNAYLLYKGGQTVDEIVSLIKLTKNLKTIGATVVVLAIVDIKAVEVAISLRAYMIESNVRYVRKGSIPIPQIGNLKEGSMLKCALDACIELQMTNEEINELLFLAEEKKTITILRSAAMLRIAKVSHEEICAIIQITTGYNGIVVSALAHMITDPLAFEKAMALYDSFEDAE